MGTKVIMEEAFPYPSEYIGTSGDGVTPRYDRAIGSASYREIWKTFFSDGIGNTEKDFGLTLLGGFGILISGGRYFADGVTGVVNRENILQVDVPPTDVERRDLVVIQNNYIDRRTYICMKKDGKSLERNDEIYEIGLYEIRVRVNAAEIQAGDITDLRSNRSWCGAIMTSDASKLVEELVPVVNDITVNLSKYIEPAVEKIYASAPPKEKIADYRTAGTYVWEVPANVRYVDVFLMGGGGGTAYASHTNGADTGGGGAGYIKNIIKTAVTPGQKINVVVGAGGTAGISTSTAGGIGGTSSFNGVTAAGGESGGSILGIGTYEYTSRPGAGSSAGGANGGNGHFYKSNISNSVYTHGYIPGQGYAAMNVNDPGRTYGRGGKTGGGSATTCDVDVGSGGDGGRTSSGTITGSAGKAGCVIIYAYVSVEAAKK